MSAADVVAKAKAHKLKISRALVYMVRGSSRRRAKPTTRRATSPGNGAPLGRPASTSSSAEALLLALGAEIGLGKAVEILEGERAKVRAAIGG